MGDIEMTQNQEDLRKILRHLRERGVLETDEKNILVGFKKDTRKYGLYIENLELESLVNQCDGFEFGDVYGLVAFNLRNDDVKEPHFVSILDRVVSSVLNLEYGVDFSYQTKLGEYPSNLARKIIKPVANTEGLDQFIEAIKVYNLLSNDHHIRKHVKFLKESLRLTEALSANLFTYGFERSRFVNREFARKYSGTRLHDEVQKSLERIKN